MRKSMMVALAAAGTCVIAAPAAMAARIDAQRDGRQLLERIAHLSSFEREAIELVDLMGLRPTDAARVLGVSPNALRVRLFRAHKRLRKEFGDDRV